MGLIWRGCACHHSVDSLLSLAEPHVLPLSVCNVDCAVCGHPAALPVEQGRCAAGVVHQRGQGTCSLSTFVHSILSIVSRAHPPSQNLSVSPPTSLSPSSVLWWWPMLLVLCVVRFAPRLACRSRWQTRIRSLSVPLPSPGLSGPRHLPASPKRPLRCSQRGSLSQSDKAPCVRALLLAQGRLSARCAVTPLQASCQLLGLGPPPSPFDSDVHCLLRVLHRPWLLACAGVRPPLLQRLLGGSSSQFCVSLWPAFAFIPSVV